jgi:hypothetical protein
MSPREERRDERLGEALRALNVPDHAPDFAARLRAQLDDAPSASAEGDARRVAPSEG